MTRQIGQIILQPVDRAEAMLPRGSRFLTVQQGFMSRTPILFVESDPNAKHENLLISILKTGDTIPKDAGEYVGSFSMPMTPQPGQPAVVNFFHVYARWTGVEVTPLQEMAAPSSLSSGSMTAQ